MCGDYMDWAKYIGIPWKFNGSDYDGCDCLGLLRIVAREQGWQEQFDDGKPIEKDWFKKEPLRLLRYLYRHFDKIDEVDQLREGDIIYFRINGEGHTGIWIGYGKFIEQFPVQHPMLKSSTHIQRFSKIKNHFICGFRRRDG